MVVNSFTCDVYGSNLTNGYHQGWAATLFKRFGFGGRY